MLSLPSSWEQGAQWWLTPEEERELEVQNSHHTAVSVVEEKVLEILDLDGPGDGECRSASEILREAGFEHPQNSQTRECGAVLRRVIGPPKRIKGIMKWKVRVAESSL